MAKMSEAFFKELGTFDLNELVNLNRLVVSMVRSKQSHENYKASAEFMVGDKVWFIAKRGRRVEGVIDKINRSKAIVKVKDDKAKNSFMEYVRWNVPFSMLTKVA
jgi:hypothetical protein